MPKPKQRSRRWRGHEPSATHGRVRLGCFWGTLSTSSHHIRSARLWLTRQTFLVRRHQGDGCRHISTARTLPPMNPGLHEQQSLISPDPRSMMGSRRTRTETRTKAPRERARRRTDKREVVEKTWLRGQDLTLRSLGYEAD